MAAAQLNINVRPRAAHALAQNQQRVQGHPRPHQRQADEVCRHAHRVAKHRLRLREVHATCVEREASHRDQEAENAPHPRSHAVAAADRCFVAHRDDEQPRIGVEGDLRRHGVRALAGAANHKDLLMQPDGGLAESAHMGRVDHRVCRAFDVIKRMVGAARCRKRRGRLEARAVGTNEHEARVVLHEERRHLAAAGDGGGAGLGAGASAAVALLVAIGLNDDAAPMLRDRPCVVHARALGQKAPQRLLQLGGALHLNIADEHALGLGCWRVKKRATHAGGTHRGVTARDADTTAYDRNQRRRQSRRVGHVSPTAVHQQP